MNVKVNDNVLVITGKYAGKQGKVVASSPKNGTVTVEGINVHKKAQKARRANEVSKIVEKEGPIDVSNVMVVCPSCGKPVRVHYSVQGDKKVRVCGGKDGCGAVLDKAYAGKKAAATKKEEPKKRTRKRAAKKDEAEAKPAETSEDKAE
jgi:large subunit ribosomal protein L24